MRLETPIPGALSAGATPAGRILAAIFDVSPDAIAINRLRDGIYVAVNARFETLTGWSAAQTQGRRVDEVEFWTNPRDVRRLARALRAGEAVQNAELSWRRRDGEARTGLLSASTLRVGEEILVLSVLRDITALATAQREREALAGQLRQAQQMEALGRLAGGVAHDFNNLLTVIGAASAMLRREGSGPDGLREGLAEIDGACDRAAALTRQLLAFGRRRPLAARPVEVGALVEEMRRLLGRVLGEDLTVALEVAPGLPPVRGDAGQVEQVLLNLALNARDAMPDGGRLTISAARGPAELPGRPRPAAGTVRLSVSDTGAGMAPEVQARIFEPFFTTKGSGKGTGLGLATVHAIVTQHGGTVTVRSTPGKGTTFDVLLPAAEEAGQAPADVRRPAAAGGGGETIVLVEDDAAVRDVTRRILGRLGYRVLAAGDAAAGLDLLAGTDGRVDLLVTDVVMPGMSGPELAARARGARPDLPVLFVSGYPDRLDAEGQAPLLSKPFSPDALADSVRRALGRAA